jgi:NhaP-type Na+/H+ and K+/H+ antiporter
MHQAAPLAIFLALGIIAVVTSKKKWLTTLFVLGWAVLGFVIGTTIGYAFGSASAAGSAAGIGMLVMGIGASIKKISDNRKTVP